MRKKVGIIKRISCLGLVFLLSINSNASIVSDNDGSAFITKAEFDALKSSFQGQIDSYNQSIDSKIDGAIASYLAGIKLTSQTKMDAICKNYGYIKSFDDTNDLPWVEPTWGCSYTSHVFALPGVMNNNLIPDILTWNWRTVSSTTHKDGKFPDGYDLSSVGIGMRMRDNGATSTPRYSNIGRYMSYILWNINRPVRDADYGAVRLVTRTSSNLTGGEQTAEWLGYYNNTCEIKGYKVKTSTADYTITGIWSIGLECLFSPANAGPASNVLNITDFIANGKNFWFDTDIPTYNLFTRSNVEDHGYCCVMNYPNANTIHVEDITPHRIYKSDKIICAFNGNNSIKRLTTNEGRFWNNDTTDQDHSFVTSITRDWWGKNVDQSLKLAHLASEFTVNQTTGYEDKFYGLVPTIAGGINVFNSVLPSGMNWGGDIKRWSDYPTLGDRLRHTKPYEGFVTNVTKQGSLYTMEFDEMAATAPSTAVKYDNYVASVWDTDKTKTTNPHLSIAAGIPVIKVKNGNTYKIKVEAQSTSPNIYFWLAKNAFAATGNPDDDTNAVNLQTENPSLTAAGNKGVRLNMTQATSADGCIITYTATEDGYLYAKWGKSTTEAGGSVRMTEVVEVNNNA